MFHFRLNKRNIEYAALEDEFRMGLQIEANRFREVSGPFFCMMIVIIIIIIIILPFILKEKYTQLASTSFSGSLFFPYLPLQGKGTRERVKLCYESFAALNLLVSVILNSIKFLFVSETLVSNFSGKSLGGQNTHACGCQIWSIGDAKDQ